MENAFLTSLLRSHYKGSAGMRPERCRDCGLAGRQRRPAPVAVCWKAINPGAQGQSPDKTLFEESLGAQRSRFIALHQFLVDLKDRVPETFGRSVVFCLDSSWNGVTGLRSYQTSRGVLLPKDP